MSSEQHMRSRRLEGHTVSVSLADGSRLDDVALVSARRGTLWVYDGGEDWFVPVDDVVDLWESRSAA